MKNQVKVAVGQVWRSKHGNRTVTISSVGHSVCYIWFCGAYPGQPKSSKNEKYFGHLTREGFPEYWDSNWTLVE